MGSGASLSALGVECLEAGSGKIFTNGIVSFEEGKTRKNRSSTRINLHSKEPMMEIWPDLRCLLNTLEENVIWMLHMLIPIILL